MYFVSALNSTVGNMFIDKNKQKNKYIEKPFLQELGMSEEEKIKNELQKMILAEEMWIKQAKQKNLPQTKII